MASHAKNAEVARLFERMADILEIVGGDSFRVSSFRRAARTISDATQDIAQLAKEDRLTELPGIGKGTAERISEYLQNGTIKDLEKLESQVPKGLPDLLNIPGMGPKKVALIHEKLKVTNLTDLKKVIESGKLAELPGFGQASVKKIAEGIAFLESSGGRTPLGLALPIAEEMAERVRRLDGVRRVELAGSIRRGVETIGDIDLLCDADDGPAVINAFVKLDGVKTVLAQGDTKGSITVTLEDGRDIQVDLRVVDSDSFGAAWQYFTGSKEHNVRLRERAVKKKWRLNEYGLWDGDKRIAGRTEDEIYKKIGVPMVPPELREDRGELDQQAPDDLLELDDIRGDLHMHTVASDGKNSIEQMAEAAKKLGYDYIAICDHSRSATIANGLSINRMEQHIEDIRRADKNVKGISILVGCECDILPDGRLDYPDDLLAECDWVVASIHLAMGSAKGSKKKSATQRTLAAIENPNVSAIGHPTGRLINTREPMELDMGEIAKAAAENGTMLEINASWQRLDLKDLHVRQAIDAGVTLVINTDAHRIEGLKAMRYGVITARRGWARKSDVANTRTLNALRKLIDKKRRTS
jgi:DNA polymerase (family X)